MDSQTRWAIQSGQLNRREISRFEIYGEAQRLAPLGTALHDDNDTVDDNDDDNEPKTTIKITEGERRIKILSGSSQANHSTKTRCRST